MCVVILEIGIGWYFNKLFPHTELFGDFITHSIETGLISAWTKQTWAGMKEEYLQSNEEKIVLPDTHDGVDPLKFQDVEGAFYLLVGGIFISIVVHLALVMKVMVKNKI